MVCYYYAKDALGVLLANLELLGSILLSLGAASPVFGLVAKVVSSVVSGLASKMVEVGHDDLQMGWCVLGGYFTWEQVPRQIIRKWAY